MGAQPIMPEKFAERNGGKSLDLACPIGLTEEGHASDLHKAEEQSDRKGRHAKLQSHVTMPAIYVNVEQDSEGRIRPRPPGLQPKNS